MRHKPHHPNSHFMRGLSLIELLVAMAIGLVVTLAVTTVLINSNANQRTSTAVNDTVQTGSFTSLSIDVLARSAGSGFVQFRQGLGCLINASIAPGPTAILPPATPLPAPFANVGTAAIPVQLAPVVILDGDGVPGPTQSDRLIIMSGSHGFSQTARNLKFGTANVSTVRVDSTLGINLNDLVLVADAAPATGCMVQQVTGTAGTQITFGNKYFASAGVTTNLPAFATTPIAAVIPIGSAGATPADVDPTPPGFFVYGVNAADELVRYNLLAPPGSPVETLAEGVVSIQAIYGIGTPTVPNDPTAPAPPLVATPLTWQGATGTYAGTSAGLLSGTAASKALFPNIKAVRIALVLRSPVQERDDVAPATLSMFTDTAVPATYTVPTDRMRFRHRVVETLIPLRNL